MQQYAKKIVIKGGTAVSKELQVVLSTKRKYLSVRLFICDLNISEN